MDLGKSSRRRGCESSRSGSEGRNALALGRTERSNMWEGTGALASWGSEPARSYLWLELRGQTGKRGVELENDAGPEGEDSLVPC